MRASKFSALLSVVAVSFPLLAFAQGAATARTSSFVGCLRSQENIYVLDVNDQTHYRLRGDNNQLNQFKNQRVRVTGTLSADRNLASVTNTLMVSGIQSAGGPCGTQAQSRRWNQDIAGKQGAPEDTEVVTSTATVGQTTPGSQTEEGAKQNPDQLAVFNTGASVPPLAGPRQAAPPNFDEAGQAEQQANVGAAAAARAEVLEGQGLGIGHGNEGMPTSATFDSAAANANSGPMTIGGKGSGESAHSGAAAAGASVAVTGAGFQPANLNLQSGEWLTLKNQTSQACNLKGPSISGMLRPGHDYRHKFTNPGTYKLSCGTASGEITVH